jgi:hypothetical protein
MAVLLVLNIRIKLDKKEYIIFLKGRRSFHSLRELDRELCCLCADDVCPFLQGSNEQRLCSLIFQKTVIRIFDRRLHLSETTRGQLLDDLFSVFL